MLYPLTFEPIFKERVWGGRKLQELFAKSLPPDVPIGESWEISDRSGHVSRIANGPLAGKEFHSLIKARGPDLIGNIPLCNGRFPLLIKLLDAREKLSLQVHPPPQTAKGLGGEPKTEMWFIADAEPGAELFAGLRRGVTRQRFEAAIKTGTVAECFHRLRVKPGDAMFLPSGRVHAIGGGIVLLEVQQNSDTTYRVFDWNRSGLDGKPRELHVRESLASIDFEDFEPGLIEEHWESLPVGCERVLVRNPLFNVTEWQIPANSLTALATGKMRILGVVSGGVELRYSQMTIPLGSGRFCLLPACLGEVGLHSNGGAACLLIEPGPGLN